MFKDVSLVDERSAHQVEQMLFHSRAPASVNILGICTGIATRSMMMTFPAIDSGFIISFQLACHFKFSLSHYNMVSFKSWNSLYFFFSLCYSCSLLTNTLYSFLHRNRIYANLNIEHFGASLPVLIGSRAVYFSPPSWCISNPSVPSLHQKLPAACGHSSKHHELVDLFERCNAALHSTRRMSGEVFEANCDIVFSTRIEFDFVPMVRIDGQPTVREKRTVQALEVLRVSSLASGASFDSDVYPSRVVDYDSNEIARGAPY